MPFSLFGWRPRGAAPVVTDTAVATSEAAGTPPSGAGERTDASPASPSAPSASGAMDRLRRPFDALRLRAAVPRVEVVIGPLTVSGSNSAPEISLKERPLVFRATTAVSESGLKAVSRDVNAAGRSAGRALMTGPRITASQGSTAGGHRAARDPAAFSAELGRMFPGTSPSTRLAATRLATTLRDHPNPDPIGRPDGHRLRHEQSLLIATVLRTVTADPAQALQVYQRLRLETPQALDDLSAGGTGEAASPALADPGRGSPAVARMTHEARRALAATAGGFQALLDMQGLALPPAGDPRRDRAEEAIELYKLGLRAEEALLASGLDVKGTRSMADIRAALDAHPQRREWLDASRLGTGNARRSPRGPHEPEHPATLAAQAFVYATDNLRRAPGQSEMHREFKPAYVALRNGFTESGQGSDFHLMAKRLRKFVTYIDLACKTPDGELPTTSHKARLPLRLLRRLAGKDKSPLETLLKAGPIEAAATVKTPQGEMDTRRDAKRLQQSFNAASPAERRDLLRQVMNAVTGGRLGTYSDGRRHAVGVTAGYGLASVAGLGGLSTGITPVVEVSAERSRAAVFRAGIAETGTLYLGSERKLNGSVGAGVRVGAEVGPLVNVSAQAMARIGGSHLVSRGLMIRTRKEGRDHETLSADQADALKATGWQRMNELVINSIFQIAGQGKTDRPAHGGAMWAQMVDRLGDFRDISFGWNEARAVAADVSVSLDATASVTLAPGVTAAASAGIGLKRTLFDRKQTRDAAGTARSVQAEQGSRSALRAGASLGIGHPSLGTPSGRGVTLFGRHRVGVETELVIQAKNGLVRLVTEEGRLRPELSVRSREFGVRDDFIRAMNAQRARWVAALENRGADEEAGSGDRKYDDFMRQLVNLPPGSSRVYQERQTLATEAAEAINACMDRLAVLQRPPSPGTPQDPGVLERVEGLQREIAALVADPAHWLPDQLAVVQSMQAAGTWSGGVDTGVTMQPGTGSGADRLLGGGRLAVAGRIQTAVGGQVLLALDAAAIPGAAPDATLSGRPDEARLSSVPVFSGAALHDTIALAH